MDINRPGMTGAEAAWRLKQNPATARIPIIAVTGASFSAQEVIPIGCDGFVLKPVSTEKLVGEISRRLPPTETLKGRARKPASALARSRPSADRGRSAVLLLRVPGTRQTNQTQMV